MQRYLAQHAFHAGESCSQHCCTWCSVRFMQGGTNARHDKPGLCASPGTRSCLPKAAPRGARFSPNLCACPWRSSASHFVMPLLPAEVLASFEEDLRFLAATELHPALRSSSGSSSTVSGPSGTEQGPGSSAAAAAAAGGSAGAAGGGPRRLIDLVDSAQLRELWASCTRSHRHYAAKVGGCAVLCCLRLGWWDGQGGRGIVGGWDGVSLPGGWKGWEHGAFCAAAAASVRVPWVMLQEPLPAGLHQRRAPQSVGIS